jgi:acyl carrier protein
MSEQTEIRANLKRLIVETLNLEGTSPESIGDDEPLFGAGLGLDSVDALELMVALEKAYKVKIEANQVDRAALSSVASLARFIEERLAAAPPIGV